MSKHTESAAVASVVVQMPASSSASTTPGRERPEEDSALTGNDLDRQRDIRAELYEALPRLIQPLITRLCAKPYAGERPAPSSATGHVLQATTFVIVGVVLAGMAWRAQLWIALPFCWMASLSGVRKLQVVIMHHCAHRGVFQSAAVNDALGTLISIVIVVKAFSQYRKDHAVHHSSQHLLTAADETIQFLMGYANLEPGRPKRVLWRRLLIGLLSPFFHLRWLLDRLASSFCSKHFGHNLLAISFWALTAWAVNRSGCWPEFLVAYAIPLTVLYNISATLRLAAEHRFPDDPGLLSSRDKRFVCRTTVAVFVSAAPPRKRSFRAWLSWTGAMLGHALARLCVLVGDTPCHDYHHRHPNSRGWVNYIAERQSDNDRGSPGFPEPYLEVWGLLRAIDQNLDAMSRVRRLEARLS